jgi:hypothetical protein
VRAEEDRGILRITEFSPEYLYLLASALGIEPSMSRRKLPMLACLIAKAVVGEAAAKGLTRLSELTDEQITALVPSENSLKKGMELWQQTTDLQNQDDFSECYDVFWVNDAGHRKDMNLTHRLATAYNKRLGKVIVRFLACSTVGKGDLAGVVVKDMSRHLIRDEQSRGSCTDSANDVLITFVNAMMAMFPGFIGAGCTLHQLHLIFIRAVYAAFGEQGKPGDSGGAGQNGVLRAPFMVNYLVKLRPKSFLAWVKRPENMKKFGDISHLTIGSSEGRWWSVLQALAFLYLHWAAFCAYFQYMANADAGKGTQQSVYTALYKEVAAWLLVPKLKAEVAYLLGHGKAWWNEHFQFNQAPASWMLDELPVEDHLGGFRWALSADCARGCGGDAHGRGGRGIGGSGAE